MEVDDGGEMLLGEVDSGNGGRVPRSHRLTKAQRRRKNGKIRAETRSKCNAIKQPVPIPADKPPAAHIEPRTHRSIHTQTDIPDDTAPHEPLPTHEALNFFEERAEAAELTVKEQEHTIAVLNGRLIEQACKIRVHNSEVFTLKKGLRYHQVQQAASERAQLEQQDASERAQLQQQDEIADKAAEAAAKSDEIATLCAQLADLQKKLAERPLTPWDGEFVRFYEDKLAEVWRVARALYPSVEGGPPPDYPAKDLADWVSGLERAVRAKAGNDAWARINANVLRISEFFENRANFRTQLRLRGCRGSEDMMGLSQISAVGSVMDDIQDVRNVRGY